jgi:hypothetical protein
VEWAGCYESAIEGEALLVLALLEGRGIPCRLESIGASVFPSMGFAVIVPADRLAEARELIENEGSGDLPATMPDPEITPAGLTVATGRPAVGDVVRRSLALARSHPSVLLTAIAGMVSIVVFRSIVDERGDIPTFAFLRAHMPELALLLVLDTVADGLTIAFVDGVLDGRPSWGEAVRRTIAQLVRLLACGTIVGTPFLVFFGWSTATRPSGFDVALLAVLALAYGYVAFRLFLASIVLLVDRTDVWGAFQRSWATTGRAWPTIVALLALGAVVSLPFALVPTVDLVVEGVLRVLGTVALVVVYRMLSGCPAAMAATR